MKFVYKPYALRFKHPFGVSGNTRNETPSIFVKLEDEGFFGYGEACLPIYLGEKVEDARLLFDRITAALEKFAGADYEFIVNVIGNIYGGNNAARAAVDMALNDLYSKKMQLPFYEWKRLNKPKVTKTSYTIGIDNEEVIVEKIREAHQFSVLKIKAGTLDDKALIRLIRKHTDKPLYVDVNQGWRDKNFALEMAEWLKDQNVLLLEQPMPKEMKEEMKWLSKRSPIPVFADESVKGLNDLLAMDGAFNGINIKLMKCGGLNEAIKMIQYCKANGIKILLGCMAESSCGTAAMTQLMAYADYVDLDAPQLYLNDPFEGVDYKEGFILPSDTAGIGAKPKPDFKI